MSYSPLSSDTQRRVLVVEDHALGRVLLASMLLHRGYAVIEVASAEEALPILREQTVDLVMLDILLTGMSGIDLCQIIRNELNLSTLPVVAYTGAYDVSSVADMRRAGFTDFLPKPIEAGALESVLQGIFKED